MSELTTNEEIEVLMTQPRLWIESMLEEHDKLRSESARHAVLARMGVVLYAVFAIAPEPRCITWRNDP